MAVDEIIVAAATGRAIGAFLEAGSLVRFELGAAAASDRRLGEIVLGRVRHFDEGLGAAFVDIGDGLSGFLNRAKAAKSGASRRPPGDGDAILVQISREAEADKAANLTAAVVLPGRTLIWCPDRPGGRLSRRIREDGARTRLLDIAASLPAGAGGWFMRRAAAVAGAAAIADEARQLLATWRRILDLAKTTASPARLWRPPDPVLAAIAEEAGPALRRIVADDPRVLAAVRAHLPDLGAELHLATGAEAAAMVQAIEAGMDALLAPDAALAGGGMIRIAETPALVAIDVDAGKHRLGGGEGTALAVNLEAAAAIVREIHRRELAGHIVVDFIAMRRQESRERVLEALRSAFAGDRLETHVGGYTRLGKVELTRRRARPSLSARLCASCPACAGSGRVLAPEAVARRGLRAALHEVLGAGTATAVVAPSVAAALRGPAADALAMVEARLGRRLGLREDPGAAADAVRLEIEGENSGRSR